MWEEISLSSNSKSDKCGNYLILLGKTSADLQALNESLQDLLDGIQVCKHIGFFRG